MYFNFKNLQFEETNTGRDKVAIGASDRDLTWAELFEKVENICEVLRKLKIPQGHPVMIFGHKEHLFPAAMLACIKLKLPYIPVDIMMPFERVKSIKNATGSEILICCSKQVPDLDFNIVIDNTISTIVNNAPAYKQMIWYPNDPVTYIMFTSGSTGEPKGVMISYDAVNSFVNWMARDFDFSSDTVFMNQASFSFDLSLFETYTALSQGSSLVLNDIETIKNSNAFLSRIGKYNCSAWVSTPSFVYVYLSEPSFNSERFPHINTFLLIGETLPARTARLLLEKFPGCRVLNSYGPTEATVATTLIEISKEILEKYPQSLPIGYPKDDGVVLIENSENNQELEGEIIIAGDHVSVGYLKNDSLTKEKFFTYNNMRAYRTGDYGYYKDGILFFNGRRDDQVKLNGFRIELGDINSKLTDIDIVDDAVTIPLKSGGVVKKIVSFIKIKPACKLAENEWRSYIFSKIESELPAYMVPGDIRFIEDFPINFNHKIDKLKLLELYTG